MYTRIHFRAAAAAMLCAAAFLIMGCGEKKSGVCESLYIKALDAYAAEDLSVALSFAEKALAYDSSFYQASFLKGKILFFMNKEADARALFGKLVKKYPEFTDARIWYIRSLILTGEYEKAQELLDRELSFNQTDWRVYQQYALLSKKMNNLDVRLAMNKRAEWALAEGSSVFFDSADMWNTMGLTDRADLYIEKARFLAGSRK